MSAFYLFCPGLSSSKKRRIKSRGKLTQQVLQAKSPVDPLYDTIPAQTKFSQDNRGRHTFEQTGKPPPSLLNTSKDIAYVLSSYSPPAGGNQVLSVLSGQKVKILQQDQEWSYVMDQRNQLGYVPSDILSPLAGSEQDSWQLNSNSNSSVHTGTPPFQLIRSESPKNTPNSTPPDSLYSKVNKSTRSSRSAQKKPFSNLFISTSPPQNVGTLHNAFTTFPKAPREIRTLLHSYRSRQENDLTVRKGEQVTVLNCSDQDWLWVVRGDGEEGFIPASHSAPVINHFSGSNSNAIHARHPKLTKQLSHSTGYRSASSTTISNHLSVAFSDHLRVTPVRSASHFAPDGPAPYLHASSEPTFDKQRRSRHRRSPDRNASREARCTTPNSFVDKRASSFEYIDRKHHDTLSSSVNIPSLQRTTSLHPPRPTHSPSYTLPHSNQFLYPQSTQRPARPAPPPPEDCLYENLNIYPAPHDTYQYPQLVPQVAQQENIYMNAPLEVDANGKPSLVPSIMTMQDRIQLLDKNPVSFPHSTSDNSIGQTSSLGDIHSVSEFNQHRNRKTGLLKEDMV